MAPTSFIQDISSFESSSSISADPGTVLVLYKNGKFEEFVPEGKKTKTPLFAGFLPNRVRTVYTVYKIRRGAVEVPITVENLHYSGLSEAVRDINTAAHDIHEPIPAVHVIARASLTEDADLEALLKLSPDDIDAELRNAVASHVTRSIRSIVAQLNLMQVESGIATELLSTSLNTPKVPGYPIKLNSIAITSWSWPTILSVLRERIIEIEKAATKVVIDDKVATGQRERERLEILSKIQIAEMLGVDPLALANPETWSALIRNEADSRRVTIEGTTSMIAAIAEIVNGPGGSSRTGLAKEILDAALGIIKGSPQVEHKNEPLSPAPQPLSLNGTVGSEPSINHLLDRHPPILAAASKVGINNTRIQGCALATGTHHQRGESLIIANLSDTELEGLRNQLLSDYGLRELTITQATDTNPDQIVRRLLSGTGADRVALDHLTAIDVQFTPRSASVAITPAYDLSRAFTAVKLLNSPESLQAEVLGRLFGRPVDFNLAD